MSAAALWLALDALLAGARAASAEQVQARLAEIQELRALRLEAMSPAPAADVVRAADGTVISGVAGDRAYGVAVVDMPIGKLWAGLNDETRQPGYTAIAYSELIAGKACGADRKVLQYLPISLVADRWWIGHLRVNGALSQQSGGSVRELVWKGILDPTLVTSEAGKKVLAEAEPIGSTRGAWFLVAIDSYTTYVEYSARVDPGGGIPESVATKLAAKGVRDTIAAVVRFSKEGHPVCPVY